MNALDMDLSTGKYRFGSLQLPNAPTTGQDASTKSYVDTAIAGVASGAQGPSGVQGPAGGPQGVTGSGVQGSTGAVGTTWTSISLANLTTTPTSTSTIATTSDLTGTLKVGYPLRYKSTGGFSFGIITGLTSSLITIAGGPLDNGNALTQIDYGVQGLVRTLTLMVSGTFQSGGADSAMLANQMKTFMQWTMTKAYLVNFQVRVASLDTGTNKPRINVALAGNAVGTLNSNAGLTVLTSSWASTVVDINTTNYVVNFGDSIELKTDANGTNADSNNLTVLAIFVMDD